MWNSVHRIVALLHDQELGVIIHYINFTYPYVSVHLEKNILHVKAIGSVWQSFDMWSVGLQVLFLSQLNFCLRNFDLQIFSGFIIVGRCHSNHFLRMTDIFTSTHLYRWSAQPCCQHLSISLGTPPLRKWVANINTDVSTILRD